MRRLLLVLLLLGCGIAAAAVETWEFNDEQQRVRYQRFTHELRCPKCQNQNLSDSNAPIAADLRRELHRLLVDGRSDQEIVDFMVSRYGEYVLYKPRLEPKTWLLWGAPVLMLLGGALVMAGLVKRARRARAETVAAELSAAEQARLRALTGEERG